MSRYGEVALGVECALPASFLPHTRTAAQGAPSRKDRVGIPEGATLTLRQRVAASLRLRAQALGAEIGG
jgi:hypothetical protein